MQKAFDRSFEMLELTQSMFIKSKEALRKTDKLLSEINIYKDDHAVNKYEREVRRNVYKHLVLAGTEQLASGLALVSIIIDVERLGDYTKNIVEIASKHGPMLKFGNYENELVDIEKAVDEYFELAIECFKKSDEDLGLELLTKYGWISKKCDELIMTLLELKHPSLEANSMVALALYIRSLKRIYSHLRNITTSVVNPFHRIGFKHKAKHRNL
jgi:phosphate uptake regulator